MRATITTTPGGRKTVIAACDEPCPIERGMRVLGGKWTGSILWHLRDEPVRFNDLARLIGGASKKMISERLKHLEEHGLVQREVLDTRPLAVLMLMLMARSEGRWDELRRLSSGTSMRATDPMQFVWTLEVAHLARHDGDPDRAATLAHEAMQGPNTSGAYGLLAWLALDRHDVDGARKLLRQGREAYTHYQGVTTLRELDALERAIEAR